jgi:putative FmdB family regulatory protein
MPLYEYKCHECGKVFEVIQKFSDAPLTTHAECGGQVEKLMSAPAFHLKGSGWYVTDYGKGNSGGNKPAAKSESGGSDSGSSSGETKAAESKPAATESKPTSTT